MGFESLTSTISRFEVIFQLEYKYKKFLRLTAPAGPLSPFDPASITLKYLPQTIIHRVFSQIIVFHIH